MSTPDSQTYEFRITFVALEGDLPSDAEVEEMVLDQLSGELDPTSGLYAYDVELTGAGEDV